MTVIEKPMPDRKPPSAAIPHAAAGGPALFLGKLGMWLAVVAFGGVFWAINGGFSVIGLGVFASSINDAGRLFWAFASAWTFNVPVAVKGLPATQPVIPWLGVVASSFLQISIIWLKLSNKPIPIWLIVSAFAASGYDYATTYFGLGTIEWIAAIGWAFQAAIAAPLTFALEFMVGYALKGGKR